MYVRLLFFLLFLPVLVGCITVEHSITNERSVKITGPVLKNNISKIIMEVKHPNVNKIIINSPGGNELAVLLLAEEIYKRKLDVYVEGVCFSACSHMLLPAANKVYVGQGSLIAFHTNILGWLEFLIDKDSNQFQKTLADGIKIFNFLEKTGANTSFLFCADALHNSNDEFTINTSGNLERESLYSSIRADLKTLEFYGVKAEYTNLNNLNYENLIKKSGVILIGQRKTWSEEFCSTRKLENQNRVISILSN